MKASQFADAIFALYPPYREWDDVTLKAWTDTIVSECGDSAFSAEIRAQAFKELTRVKHKEKPPQPATIIQHCFEVKRWLNVESKKGSLPLEQEAIPSSWVEHSNDRKKLAIDLLRSPMGRQAAREGWIGALDAYVRRKAKMPPPAEIGALKRKAKEFDEAYALCVRGVAEIETWVPKDKRAEMIRCREDMLKVCEGIGAKLLREREDLVDRILHGVVQ